MDAMDIAVDLVETYLRLNGYLTMSEFEIQRRGENGLYETVTDVDIVGFRLPGDMDAADEQEDGRMLQISDPAMELPPDMIDVILGEVKQGDAQFNPASPATRFFIPSCGGSSGRTASPLAA
jgi:hypothetical protein